MHIRGRLGDFPMPEKQVLIGIITLTLFGLLILGPEIKNVKAPLMSIQVRPDGSIYPPDAASLIQRDGNLYTLTTDIDGSIEVQKENITIDGGGYSLRGSGGGYGFYLNLKNGVTIRRTSIENFYYAIRLTGSNNNSIVGNNITENNYGIWFSAAENNSFFHNNFLLNTRHVYMDILCCNSSNYWDNGFEGNYWSNYSGVDADRDGVGDNPHSLADDNTDERPLMGLFRELNTSTEQSVDIISNSTIKELEYQDGENRIRVLVVNSTTDQEHGFVRMRIPISLVPGELNVSVDGANPTFWNYSLRYEGENRWIYFSFEHSEVEIVIVSEFSSAVLLLLLITTTFLVALFIKSKRLLAQPSEKR